MATTKPVSETVLRKRVAAAIASDGLYKTAAAVGVKPETLQRFVYGATTTKPHKGTLALIERKFG